MGHLDQLGQILSKATRWLWFNDRTEAGPSGARLFSSGEGRLKRSARSFRLSPSGWYVPFWILVMMLFAVACNAGAEPVQPPPQTVAQMGALTGRATRYPASPVENVGQPPPTVPFPGARIRVLAPGGHEVASAVTDEAGKYRLSLSPGTYRIEIGPLGPMAFTKDLPRTITICPGRETRLDISVDIGLR